MCLVQALCLKRTTQQTVTAFYLWLYNYDVSRQCLCRYIEFEIFDNIYKNYFHNNVTKQAVLKINFHYILQVNQFVLTTTIDLKKSKNVSPSRHLVEKRHISIIGKVIFPNQESNVKFPQQSKMWNSSNKAKCEIPTGK